MSDDTLAKLTGVVAVGMFIIGLVLGIHLGHIKIEEEAVREHHAEWLADASGKPQFKWKEAKL